MRSPLTSTFDLHTALNVSKTLLVYQNGATVLVKSRNRRVEWCPFFHPCDKSPLLFRRDLCSSAQMGKINLIHKSSTSEFSTSNPRLKILILPKLLVCANLRVGK